MPRILAFLALVLLAGFFLPWLPDMGGLGNGATMSGFDLVYALVDATREAAAGGASVGDMITSEAWQGYLLVLIPVFGLLTLLLGLAGAGIASLTAFLAGLPAIVVVGKGLLDEGTATFGNFEIGAWVTLGASVLLVLLAFVPRGRG